MYVINNICICPNPLNWLNKMIIFANIKLYSECISLILVNSYCRFQLSLFNVNYLVVNTI